MFRLGQYTLMVQYPNSNGFRCRRETDPVCVPTYRVGYGRHGTRLRVKGILYE